MMKIINAVELQMGWEIFWSASIFLPSLEQRLVMWSKVSEADTLHQDFAGIGGSFLPAYCSKECSALSAVYSGWKNYYLLEGKAGFKETLSLYKEETGILLYCSLL